jgi:hypothetical protein
VEVRIDRHIEEVKNAQCSRVSVSDTQRVQRAKPDPDLLRVCRVKPGVGAVKRLEHKDVVLEEGFISLLVDEPAYRGVAR